MAHGHDEKKYSCTGFETPKELGLQPGEFVYTDQTNEVLWGPEPKSRRQPFRLTTIRDALYASVRAEGSLVDHLTPPQRTLNFVIYHEVHNPMRLVFVTTYGDSTTMTIDANWPFCKVRACLPKLIHMPHSSRILDSWGGISDYDTAETRLWEDEDRIDIIPQQVGGGYSFDQGPELTFGVGAEIQQAIIPDVQDPKMWDTARARLLSIQILNSAQFESLTGMPIPPLPIPFEEYLKRGLHFIASPNTKDIQDDNISALATLQPATYSSEGNESGSVRGQEGGASIRRKIELEIGPRYPGFCQACKKPYMSAHRQVHSPSAKNNRYRLLLHY